MTSSRLSFVDVYVFRGRGESLEVLALRRARGRVRPGTWEGVHGRIDADETAVDAARREMHEETGCHPMALYNLSRVEHFYLHQSNEIAAVPVFAGFVAADAVVVLSGEHDMLQWIRPGDASERFSWPRAWRAIADAVRLVGEGHAGVLEDVLRIEP